MKQNYIYLCVAIIVGFTSYSGYSQGACCSPTGSCASSITIELCRSVAGQNAVWLQGVECLPGPNPCTRVFSVSGKAYSQTITVVSVNNDRLYLVPNPATTTLRVLLSNMQSYDTELSLHDLSGRQVRSYRLNRGQNEINVSGLPQGTYIMKARMNGNTYTSRFVKN